MSALVRDAAFGRDVLRAYGRRCAMCGLGLRLVQGAHTYPASAPGSPDRTYHGLALFANHHVAFDRYIVAILPDTVEILYHPEVLDEARVGSTADALVTGTPRFLRSPRSGHEPEPTMFARRYAHYGEKYDWLLR